MAALHAGTLIGRDLARVAGVLLSVKDAVHMAPLYTRLLFAAMGVQCWDDAVPGCAREFAAEDLRYWRANLSLLSGKSWLRRSCSALVFGDVSESGFGGFSALLDQPVIQAFSCKPGSCPPPSERS